MLLRAAGLLCLFGITPLMRRLTSAALARVERHLQRADSRFIALIPDQLTRILVIRVFAAIRLLLCIVVIYTVVQMLLGLFPFTRPIAQQLLTGVLGPVQSFGMRCGSRLLRLRSSCW